MLQEKDTATGGTDAARLRDVMSRCGALASERPKATFSDKNVEQVGQQYAVSLARLPCTGMHASDCRKVVRWDSPTDRHLTMLSACPALSCTGMPMGRNAAHLRGSVSHELHAVAQRLGIQNSATPALMRRGRSGSGLASTGKSRQISGQTC